VAKEDSLMSLQNANFQNVMSWLNRLSRLDLGVFDDVRDDQAATMPVVLMVIISSFLSGLGSWLWWLFQDLPDSGQVFVKSFLLGSIFQVGVWFLWVYITYSLLARALGTVGNVNQLIRTMGLGFIPVALSVLVFISVLTVPFGIISLGGALLLTNIAILRTASARLEQITLANFAGFSVFAIIMGVLANIAQVYEIGGLAPGLFFFVLE
jgi:hypothetical protein